MKSSKPKSMFYGNVGWVTDYGEFGTNKMFVFEPKALTKRQWRIVDELHESDRLGYVEAILTGDTLSIKAYESEV